MRGLVTLVALVSLVRVAHADDKAAAEALFLKAKKLEKAGQTADACDAYAKSQQLDPQFGTEYNLALCDVNLGKLATAWELLRELAQKDTNAKRKKDSEKRAASLDARISKLLITTAGPVEPGLVVHRGDDDVTNLLGVEDPVDDGSYHVTATAPGFQDWSNDVSVSGEGAVITVKIPSLTPVEAAHPIQHEPPPPPHDTTKIDEEPPAPPPAHHSHRKLVGLTIAGVGVASLGVGLYFGSVASSDWSKATDVCPEQACANQADLARGGKLVDDAKKAGNLSTIFVGAGVAVAATGVILWLTAPHAAEHVDASALRVVPTGNGLAITGGF